VGGNAPSAPSIDIFLRGKMMFVVSVSILVITNYYIIKMFAKDFLPQE